LIYNDTVIRLPFLR